MASIEELMLINKKIEKGIEQFGIFPKINLAPLFKREYFYSNIELIFDLSLWNMNVILTSKEKLNNHYIKNEELSKECPEEYAKILGRTTELKVLKYNDVDVVYEKVINNNSHLKFRYLAMIKKIAKDCYIIASDHVQKFKYRSLSQNLYLKVSDLWIQIRTAEETKRLILSYYNEDSLVVEHFVMSMNYRILTPELSSFKLEKLKNFEMKTIDFILDLNDKVVGKILYFNFNGKILKKLFIDEKVADLMLNGENLHDALFCFYSEYEEQKNESSIEKFDDFLNSFNFKNNKLNVLIKQRDIIIHDLNVLNEVLKLDKKSIKELIKLTTKI